MKKAKLFLLATLLFIFPYIILAQGTGSSGNAGGGTASKGNTGGSVGLGSSVKLNNPLKSDSLMDFFTSVLDVIMVFAVPIIVFFIILAGFQFVMAQGNATGVEKAKKALLYAIIGGLIILGAKIILTVIQGTVSAF